MTKGCFILSVGRFLTKIWLRQFVGWFRKKMSFSHCRQLYTMTQDGVGGGVMKNHQMQGGQGNKKTLHVTSHAERPGPESLLFWNFFRMTKSSRKAYFLREKSGSLERKPPRLGIGIFWIFWHLRHFRALSIWKKQGPFNPWSPLLGLTKKVWCRKACITICPAPDEWCLVSCMR
jgi:hypothetical protein